ncbi:MAG: signal peptidase I [Sedimentisphaerales bacterium]|nr:signal peptidase I [Sedimentisphaerales bacterium]
MDRTTRTWLALAGPTRRKALKFGRGLWHQWRIPLFLIVFVVIPVKSSLADWNWVPTGSMNPTILPGDLIFVNKAAYDLRVPLTLHRLAHWSEPQRGDIVICLSPDDGIRLVKRVIALPGDTLEMRDNVLLLNGTPLTYRAAGQDYLERLSDELAHSCICALEQLDKTTHPVLSVPSIRAERSFGPVTVTDDHYFMLGDNRDLSRDSRFFGLVPRRSILGKAKGVILSFDITEKYQPRFGRFFSHLQ